MKATTVMYAGGAIVGLVAIAYLLRQAPKLAGAAGAALTSAGKIIVDAPAAAVKAIGATVGIPETDGASCAAAIASGRMWDASFHCPAKDFLAAMWTRMTGNPTSSAAVLDRDDQEAGAAMSALLGTPVNAIDLGTYADTIARDDLEMGRFADLNAFYGPTGPALWDSNATARLLRRPVSVPANSEYQ